jgi:hypothetical protein
MNNQPLIDEKPIEASNRDVNHIGYRSAGGIRFCGIRKPFGGYNPSAPTCQECVWKAKQLGYIEIKGIKI